VHQGSAVTPRERLIVALDQGNTEESERLVRDLDEAVSFYKVNWVTLLSPGGTSLLQSLRSKKKDIFLDLKIFDVPNTVREAVAAAANMGVRFATVHGNKPMVQAAVNGRTAAPGLKLLAVTALTSLTAGDVRALYQIPEQVSLEDHVINVVRHMVGAGVDGVIASPQEVERIRQEFPDQLLIVAPGIRMLGESTHDHKRPGYPYESIKAGADYLVVGRSIYRDPDPKAKAEQYVKEIERGIRDRVSRK
jgi:orotidine-5'-phosphate decarboxylase